MQVKTAYETLKDEGQRAEYERSRRGGYGAGLGGNFGSDWSHFTNYARCALTNSTTRGDDCAWCSACRAAVETVHDLDKTAHPAVADKV